MSGGGGHISDFNNKIRNNRNLKHSKRSKFKQSTSYLRESRKDNFLVETKVLSEEERKLMKLKIHKKLQSQRKKQIVLLSLIFLFIIISVIILIFQLNK